MWVGGARVSFRPHEVRARENRGSDVARVDDRHVSGRKLVDAQLRRARAHRLAPDHVALTDDGIMRAGQIDSPFELRPGGDLLELARACIPELEVEIAGLGPN